MLLGGELFSSVLVVSLKRSSLCLSKSPLILKLLLAEEQNVFMQPAGNQPPDAGTLNFKVNLNSLCSKAMTSHEWILLYRILLTYCPIESFYIYLHWFTIQVTIYLQIQNMYAKQIQSPWSHVSVRHCSSPK